MKSVKHLIIGFVLLLSLGFTSFVQAANGFTDVPDNHGFKDRIDHLVKLGAINGYLDGRFNPAGNVTRGQAAKIITIALDMPLVNPTKPSFKDIPRDHGFYQHIETLFANGIIKGYPDGTFGGGKPVMRSHMAKIVSNSLALTEMSDVHFKDVPKTSEYYPYINKIATAGITTGKLDGTYGMTSNVTRGQMAAFVSRGVDHVEGTSRDPDPNTDAYWYRQVHFGMTKAQVKAAEGKASSENKFELIYDEIDMNIYMAKITYSFKNDRMDSISLDFDIRNVTFDESEAFFKSMVEDVYEPQFFEPSSMVDQWENHNGNELLTANWDIEGHENLLAYLQMSTGYGRDSVNLSFTIYEY